MKKIKIHDPYFGKEEKKAIEKVLDSHMWASSKGNNNASKFEEKFKNFVNADECVAIDSGSSALLLSMNIMDIKNKEVIIPSLCHVSVAHSVVLNGGKPVFVDVDPKTLCLNANLIKKAITKKTKVVVAVHFGGFPCNMDEISDICKKNKNKLIEYAALETG